MAQEEDWLAVITLFTEIRDLAPDYPDPDGLLGAAYHAQALEFMSEGKWTAAVERLEEVCKLLPDHPDARTQLKIARQEQAEARRRQQAADLYAEAVRLLKAEQWQAALAKLTEARGIIPNHPDPQRVKKIAKKKLEAARRPRRAATRPLLILGGVVAVLLLALSIYARFGGGDETTPTPAPTEKMAIAPPTETPRPANTRVVIVLPSNTPTATPMPTATPVPPTATPTPTATPLPPAATPTSCADNAAFVSDVTVPDGAQFNTGDRIDKVWRLRNTGTCAWRNYKLVFVSGAQMDAPRTVAVPETAPGATVDIGVQMTAPSTDGAHTGTWQMQNAQGQAFGEVVFVKINVGAAGMVRVPAGEFPMGSDDGGGDEQPVHTVYLDEFWIDKYEATNAQYEECVDAGECQAPYQSESRTRDSYYGNAAYDNYPVIYVDWRMADTYCRWVGKRLPTEAEWEKAARGPEGRKYPWGNEAPDADKLNYDENVGDTMPVGSYPAGASPYGALDMAGNVWEWVADWYEGGYYQTAAASAPNPQGPASGDYRVLRGGSYYNSQGWVRGAFRYWYSLIDWFNSYGFRCAVAAGSP